MTSDALAFTGRLSLAAIFVWSVQGKLSAPTGTIEYIASAGLPLPTFAYLGAVAVELVGAAALVLGIATRSASLALALFCIAAAVVFHPPGMDENQLIHFLKNVAIAGGLLQVAAFGPGGWVLARLTRRDRPAAA